MPDTAAHYTVLARRFRPQTFDEVVGQDRIGTAIRNAIRAERVAHAYLFTGARGVGKTSTARIFAKALNCPNVVDAVPCNDCEVCHAISVGSDVDVLEIDGASNNGVDDVRELRANVGVRAMRSPYKLYIIDEVHMLSKSAFNALLKTLEEPPPNVKFVFCTTEPNKVPDTILSRCQRFDFGTISPASIAGRLAQIADAEGVDVEEAALELLARRAAGSMRDSQSLFDQLLAFGGEQITAADVHQLLGTAGDDRLVGLMDAVIQRRRGEALTHLDSALEEGVQIGAFSDQLLHYLRDMLMIAAGADAIALESVSESEREHVAEQATAWGLKTIAAALEILATTKSRMQRVNYDRALLELAITRLSLLEDLDQIGAVISGLQSGSSGGGASAQSPQLRPTRQSDRPAAPEPPAGSRPSPQVGPPGPQNVQRESTQTDAPGSTTSRERDEEPATPAASSPQHLSLSEASKEEFWSQVLTIVPDKLRAHLDKCDAIAIIGPNRLELSFPQSYVLSRQFCERPETQRRIADLATEIAGETIEISVIAGQTVDSPLPKQTENRRQPPPRRKTAEVEKDPFVQQALDVFGGTLIDAREIHGSAGEGR